MCIFPGGKAGNVVNGISKGSCHLYPELIYEQWPGSRNKRFSGPGGDAEERGERGGGAGRGGGLNRCAHMLQARDFLLMWGEPREEIDTLFRFSFYGYLLSRLDLKLSFKIAGKIRR